MENARIFIHVRLNETMRMKLRFYVRTHDRSLRERKKRS